MSLVVDAGLNKILYRQEKLPIFQNRMYSSVEEAKSCLVGDMVLVEDQTTGLIRNSAFRAELMNYDTQYQNEQAVSPYFRQHLETVLGIVERSIGKQKLIEVGCGKAYFLELLIENGFEVTGFDPTYEGSNSRVEKCYFEAGINIKAEGLILRHVLEHIEAPFNFLQGLKEANNGRGRIYIEVPCFDWILQRRAWYDIFYEHVNYFRLSDFRRMFSQIIECGRLFGDQYIYIVADLETLKVPAIDPEDRIQFPADFIDAISSVSNVDANKTVVWGGASKGVIFSLLKERSGQPVDAVIDINPAKQGKYLPATGLRVSSAEEILPKLPRGSSIYVMNSNYLEEIRTMSNAAFEYIGIDNG